MGILAIVIKKVAEQASKIVLLGALVGGVSMMSYATETPVGPTIEKAQLEAVHINLDELVEAITKVDPDWVKGLPLLKGISDKNYSKRNAMVTHGVLSLDEDDERLYITTSTVDPGAAGCGDSESIPCKITFNDSLIQYDDNGNPFILESAAYTPIGKGPYTP